MESPPPIHLNYQRKQDSMTETESAQQITVGMTVEWTNDNLFNFDGPMVVEAIDGDSGLVLIEGHAWTHLSWVRPVNPMTAALAANLRAALPDVPVYTEPPALFDY